jgi:hypothetical protein
VFGCDVYVLSSAIKRRKLSQKGGLMKYIGHDTHTNGYKVYDVHSHKVHITRDIKFLDSFSKTKFRNTYGNNDITELQQNEDLDFNDPQQESDETQGKIISDKEPQQREINEATQSSEFSKRQEGNPAKQEIKREIYRVVIPVENEKIDMVSPVEYLSGNLVDTTDQDDEVQNVGQEPELFEIEDSPVVQQIKLTEDKLGDSDFCFQEVVRPMPDHIANTQEATSIVAVRDCNIQQVLDDHQVVSEEIEYLNEHDKKMQQMVSGGERSQETILSGDSSGSSRNIITVQAEIYSPPREIVNLNKFQSDSGESFEDVLIEAGHVEELQLIKEDLVEDNFD